MPPTLPEFDANDPALKLLLAWYDQMEGRLIETLRDATVQGWERDFARAMLRGLDIEIRRLERNADVWDARYLREQWVTGQTYADGLLRDIEGVPWDLIDEPLTPPREALAQLAREASGKRTQMIGGILRQSDDYLRRLATGELAQGLGLGRSSYAVGKAIREGAINAVRRGAPLEEIARGIMTASGVIYSDDTVHSLHAYGQMSARTGMAQALRAGQLDRFADTGLVHVVKIPANGTLCFLCGPTEGKCYAIDAEGEKLGYPPISAWYATGAGHPNCFPAGVLVSGPRAVAASRRWYEGEMIILHTADGDKLPVTPNHPILTTKGWVAAGALVEGDNVIRCDLGEGIALGISPDDEQVPSRIEDIPSALLQTGTVAAHRVKTAAEDFHGDGVGSDVCVIFSDSELGNARHSTLFEPLDKLPFFIALMGYRALLALRATAQVFIRPFLPANGIMGGLGQGKSLLFAYAGETNTHGFRLRSNRETVFSEPFLNNAQVDAERISNGLLGFTSQISPNDLRLVELDAELLDTLARLWGHEFSRGSIIADRDSSPFQAKLNSLAGDAGFTCQQIDRLPGEVSIDELKRHFPAVSAVNIVRIGRIQFAGHVYNLQTKQGWFIANSIITHNCRHAAFSPVVFPDRETDLPPAKWTLSADDKEMYRRFRDEHPERYQASRQGFARQGELAAWKKANPDVDFKDLRGPRWRYRGIEERRQAAIVDMLLEPELPYADAVAVQTERFMAGADYARQRPAKTPAAQAAAVRAR